MIRMLFTILLLEGFITISVEILTIRQLLPFFGGSVVITSLIIGVFLLFLALGYWRGGLYQQDFFRQLSRNFAWSLVWVGVGLSYFFVALFYQVFVIQVQISFLLALVAYLLLVLAPVVYWLGQTIPLTTNLFNQQQRVSRISGRALFLSTIGSFLGAIATSLLLFQYVGVGWTVVFNCMLLFCLIVCMHRQSQWPWEKTGGLLLVLVGAFWLNVEFERNRFVQANNYANYEVIETPAFERLLQINRSNSSLLTATQQGYPYVEFMRDLLFNQFKLRNKEILVIGAGGFTLTAAGTHGNQVTYVDIDPAIKAVAQAHFLKQGIQGTFVGEDARSYLQRVQTPFDAIVSDVYSHQSTIPPALLTVEYFQAIAQHLNPGGVMIANIIANPQFQDEYSRVVHNSIHAAFPYCAVIPLHWVRPMVNMMYVCFKQPVDGKVYRDDLNSATLDFFKSRGNHRN